MEGNLGTLNTQETVGDNCCPFHSIYKGDYHEL